MRAPILLVLCLSGLFLAPPAAAQGAGMAAASRISVSVPERRPSVAPIDASNRARQSAGTQLAAGHSVQPMCETTLEIAKIGAFSVSCLETAGAYGGSAGVSLDVEFARGHEPSRPASGIIELLIDGQPLRLHGRVLGGAGGAGEPRGVQTAIPAVAFERIALARTVTLVVAGSRHDLTRAQLDALRRVAAGMRAGAPARSVTSIASADQG